MSKDFQKDSCAIVVTYKPDITALLKLLGQLNKETDFVVIDNDSQNIEKLSESIKVYEQCRKIICLERNEGLAKALNIGIDWALENGRKFVFLFDQDSSLCDLFVNRMIGAYWPTMGNRAAGQINNLLQRKYVQIIKNISQIGIHVNK